MLVAALTLAVIVPLALLSNQAPPPAIAEFAPQAQAQHQSSPQSSKFGNANSDELGAGAVGATPTPAPTPPLGQTTIYDRAKTKSCVGALQTPDPQSPPCNPYWVGNNGGSTTQGVSGQYINIAIGQLPGDQQAVDDLIAYFNKNYELYDRQLRIVAGPPTLFAATDPQHQIQYADQIAATTGGVFMSGSFGAYGSESIYYDELRRKGVMGIDQNPMDTSEDHWTAEQPYQWSAIADYPKQERYLGAFVCETLAKKAPDLAPPQPTTTFPGGPPTRRFAIVIGQSESGAPSYPDDSILEQDMNGCGATIVAKEQMSGPGPYASFEQQSTQAMSDIVAKGATTVICLCSGNYLLYGLFPAATSQHKYPEWIGSSYGDLDRADEQIGYPSDQMSHFFGMTWRNKLLPLTDEWWYQAIKSVDPTWQYSDGTSSEFRQTYKDLMFIATGVQEAGPDLTPASFQAGLFRTEFPDPGAGQAPYYQATIGYGPDDHSEFQDVALFYYYPAGHPDDNSKQTGIDCYVDGGRRFTPGNFPTTDSAFFNPRTC
ncbi:MAG: hypothetical protein ACYDAC_10095 [Candidatus Dormibacteria bacterium]